MSCSTIFREPRSTQERRAIFQIAADIAEASIPIHLRGKRSFRNLPNAWDDFCRERTRSWKNYRKTQYRSH